MCNSTAIARIGYVFVRALAGVIEDLRSDPVATDEHGLDELVNGRVVIHDQEPVWLPRWHSRP